MEIKPCTVLFDQFIPLDLIRTPYIIWSSMGEHTHLPPPPTKTPAQYLEEIMGIIRRINNPGLTLSIDSQSNILRMYY
jgi:hypothetical protein